MVLLVPGVVLTASLVMERPITSTRGDQMV